MKHRTIEYLPQADANASAFPSDEINDPNSDTLSFACLSPQAFALSQGVLPLTKQHLRWRSRTLRLCVYVLTEAGGVSDSIFRSYAQLGASEYSHQSEKSQRKSAKDMLRVAREDFAASGFQFFGVKRGHIKGLAVTTTQSKRGEKKRAANFAEVGADQYIPTEYWLDGFLPYLKAVQDAAIAADIGALPAREQKAALLRIVQSVCRVFGYQPIDGEVKEPKAAKADKLDNETDLGTRRTTKDVEEWIGTLADEVVSNGQVWVNTGAPWVQYDTKVARATQEGRTRLKVAHTRAITKRDVEPNEALRIAARQAVHSALASFEEAEKLARNFGDDKLADKLRKAAEFAEKTGEYISKGGRNAKS